MDAVELAWATGLFEGEGSVVAARRRERYYIRLIVYSTDLDVLERWQRIMGGAVRERRPQKEGYKRSYYVELGAQREATAAIEAMLPLLGSRRRKRAEEVLAMVAANAPVGYDSGWAKRRERYGANGRRTAAAVGE